MKFLPLIFTCSLLSLFGCPRPVETLIPESVNSDWLTNPFAAVTTGAPTTENAPPLPLERDVLLGEDRAPGAADYFSLRLPAAHGIYLRFAAARADEQGATFPPPRAILRLLSPSKKELRAITLPGVYGKFYEFTFYPNEEGDYFLSWEHPEVGAKKGTTMIKAAILPLGDLGSARDAGETREEGLSLPLGLHLGSYFSVGADQADTFLPQITKAGRYELALRFSLDESINSAKESACSASIEVRNGERTIAAAYSGGFIPRIKTPPFPLEPDETSSDTISLRLICEDGSSHFLEPIPYTLELRAIE